jgi:hypothetical protein
MWRSRGHILRYCDQNNSPDHPVTNDIERLVIKDCQINIASTATGPKRGAAALLIDNVQLFTQ